MVLICSIASVRIASVTEETVWVVVVASASFVDPKHVVIDRLETNLFLVAMEKADTRCKQTTIATTPGTPQSIILFFSLVVLHVHDVSTGVIYVNICDNSCRNQ